LETGSGTNDEDMNAGLHPATLEMTEAFIAECHCTQEALMLGVMNRK